MPGDKNNTTGARVATTEPQQRTNQMNMSKTKINPDRDIEYRKLTRNKRSRGNNAE